MNLSVHNTIKNEYENRQRKAYDELSSKRTLLYKKLPRLEEIENEIFLSGLKYNKLLIFGHIPHEEIISELNVVLNELKNEKELLLETHGYPRDFLRPSYTCEKCQDTGYLKLEANSQTEMCSCYKQQMINIIYSQSNLRLTGKESFNSFNVKYYPDTVNESRYGIKKSPRRQISGIKDHCLNFIDQFESPELKNMLFCGSTGTGKTFMAICTAVELMNKGNTVLYQSAPALFSAINEYRMKLSRDDGYENSTYKNILDADLLIIDDLGTESPSAARYAELLNILDSRHANNLNKPCKTIISTNIDIKELFTYYDERVVSRITGNFDIFKFAGDDIRKLRTEKDF
jgi:DNA replication protein DnaC